MLYILYKFLHLELLMMFRQRNWGTCERRIATRFPHSDYAICFHFRAQKHKGFCALLHSLAKYRFSEIVAEQRALAWVLC